MRLWKKMTPGVLAGSVWVLVGCSEPVQKGKAMSKPETEREAEPVVAIEEPVSEPVPEPLPATSPKPEPDPETAMINEIRSKHLGEMLKEIHVENRAFLEAQIKRVNEEGVVIQHLNGANFLKWDEVPSTLRKEWGYK